MLVILHKQTRRKIKGTPMIIAETDRRKEALTAASPEETIVAISLVDMRGTTMETERNTTIRAETRKEIERITSTEARSIIVPTIVSFTATTQPSS